MARQLLACCLLVFCALPSAQAAPLRLAVAANFATPIAEIATLFAGQSTGQERPAISIGASGQLAAQILKGAPYDLFLSADQERVEQLIARDLVAPSGMKIYARGQLVFWQPGFAGTADLRGRLSTLNRLAHANERLAPYGRAAKQVLQFLSLARPPAIVRGQSVGQVYAMIHSGAVAGGFVAKSQVIGKCAPPICMDIDPAGHDAIAQAVGLLKTAPNPVAARAFYQFLDKPEIQALIARHGYVAQGVD